MKTIICLGALLLVGFLGLSWAGAASTLGTFAESPDHPATWVSGADNVHQALRWDDSRRVLVADVKYSTIAYADNTHPTEENDYTLSFPAVRFDAQSGEFTAKGTKVATLHHGIFGADVVLDKGVELSVHRHHGHIFASLMPSDD